MLGVLAALADGAQLTRSEVCRELGRERMAVASVMSRMNKPTAWKPKRIYVVGYVFEDDEGRRYPRALYALGALPDAKKPKVVAGAVQARYRQRNKGQVASVWDLGKVGLGRRQQFKESFR